ncbi:MAG: S-layer homology domain-containing protein, partial [Moorella sp. (in: Bacteria)]|nr:S-layer homology domain-containing protein [Moorella sp. (in: firmicutes)]
GRGKITASFNGRQAEVSVQIECLFKDSAQSWAFEQIEDLAAAGLVKGFEDGTFRPAQPVTRSEMTALLARLLDWPPAPREARFKDQLPEWAKGVISAAVAQNIIKGYPDGTFQANNYITRAELCAILDRALKPAPAKEKPGFKDNQEIPAWAKEAVARVVAGGLIRGYEDNTLRPKAQVTRAEMATVLWRQLHTAN